MYFTAGKKIDVLKFRIYYTEREKTSQIVEVVKEFLGEHFPKIKLVKAD